MTSGARRRRPDWLIALAMLVGLGVTMAAVIAIAQTEDWSPWLTVPLAVVLSILGAIGAGILVMGEP